MAALNIKLLFTFCFVLSSLILFVKADENGNFLDIEAPTVFNYNSPLKEPDSLRSRPYFDFLSTLYRHDSTKSELFRPYLRQRREAIKKQQQQQPAPVVASPLENVAGVAAQPEARRSRAIVFRPLFVYRQQQVRKQEAARRRKTRV